MLVMRIISMKGCFKVLVTIALLLFSANQWIHVDYIGTPKGIVGFDISG